jgi:sulfite exporter TauE/SafE
MCGSIMGALTLSLPSEIREGVGRFLLFVVLYNLGRVLTYVFMGVLIGFTGQLLGDSLEGEGWRQAASIVAAVTIILIGLYLTGWVPFLRNMDRLGGGLWKLIEPIGRKLLPVRTPHAAFLSGLIWGWLPCGLVYYALILALPLSDPVMSGLFMLGFGLGTLPVMLGTAIFASSLARLGRNVRFRQAAGVVVILVGILGLLFGADVFLVPLNT